MKRLLSVILLVLIAALTACTPSPGGGDKNPQLKFVSEFEGGKLYKAGAVSVLELEGNYRQMGRQYGALLKTELNELYDIAINGEYIQKQQFTYERIKTVSDALFDFYPQRYKDIIYGMAETSGLGIEKQIILNAIEWPPKMGKSAPRCTGFGVWGDYTKDGSMIFGRYNDDTPFFREFAKYTVVAVFKATDSTINTALINYAGVIYAANGMNSNGIFLELNSGNAMGFYPDRTSIFVTLFSFLQDYPTIQQMSAAFQATKVNLSSIINVADRNIAYSFECSPDTVKRREPDKNGLLISTNHFVDPEWKIPPPADDEKAGWTIKRQDNLLTLGEKYRGQFDAEKMMQVLDLTIENGGATTSGTIFQIIAVPEDLTLWLKAPGNFDWQKVDISKLLSNSK